MGRPLPERQARAEGKRDDDVWPATAAALYAGGPGGVDLRREARLPGRIPLYPRRLPLDVSRAALDDPAIRRLWQRGGDESPLQVPTRARAGGPLGGGRHADLDGLRLRRSTQRRAGTPWPRRDPPSRWHG